MLATDLLLCGIIGLSVWAVQMLWIPLFAAGVINGVGHAIGYRNHQCPDASTNIVPWGILIGGEELHNNHPAHPGSARLIARQERRKLGPDRGALLKRVEGVRPVRTSGSASAVERW